MKMKDCKVHHYRICFNMLQLRWPACVWATIGVLVGLVCTSQEQPVQKEGRYLV